MWSVYPTDLNALAVLKWKQDVWKGRTTENAALCLKVIRNKKRRGHKEKYCPEAQIWSTLSHPNILPFLGANVDLFAPYLCLASPWMSNGNIMPFLEQNPDHDRLKSIIEVAKGLDYLHNLDPVIVHSDIRGANITLTDDFTCCLGNFGASFAVEKICAFPLTTTWTPGSPDSNLRWMAPELIRSGEEIEVQPASRDVYSFGCTLIEIYTNTRPYADIVGEDEVYRQISTGKKPSISPVQLPSRRLYDLIQRCLEGSTASRPNAAQVLAGLQTIKEERDIPSARTSLYNLHISSTVSDFPDATGSQGHLGTPNSLSW
ncbi:kinase-like domain-containing protein [Armillaria mellea]|nr:kinase-like domain-containing protein [Armillaria mellea]